MLSNLAFLVAITFAPLMDPVVKSGTRIEVRFDAMKLTGGDGSEFLSRSDPYFFDKTLNHRCDIFEWSRFGDRCVPTNDNQPISVYPAYTDSTCSTRLISIKDNPSAAVAEVFGWLEGELYQADFEITTTATTFFMKDPLGRCNSAPLTSIGPTWRFFAAKTPGLMFVPFTRTKSVVTAP